jgi:hypothetical protein
LEIQIELTGRYKKSPAMNDIDEDADRDLIIYNQTFKYSRERRMALFS